MFDELEAGWTKLPLPPEVRSSAATAWTGEELIVWGGHVYFGFGDEVPQSDGFSFDGPSRTWEKIAAAPLSPRINPATAWTGTEILIWGGSDEGTSFYGDGAAYDPATDTWRELPEAPLSARAPLSVWTGQEFILWGARFFTQGPGTGAAFDPVSNTWRTIAEAPEPLTRATAVWTGLEMIVLGDSAVEQPSHAELAVAMAYNPVTDTWRRLPNSPLAEEATTTSWDGQEVIAWDYNSDTAAYDPVSNEWRRLGNAPLDDYECTPNSVWIEGYFFGDYCGGMVAFDPSNERWHDVSREEFLGWGFTIVAADPVVLLLGRSVDTGEEAMFAYRPPSW